MTALQLIGIFGTDDAAPRSHSRSGETGFDESRRITDAATLAGLRNLDEHYLRDVGVVRKPRPTKWHSLARGMDPIANIEFDYFRLRRVS